MFPGTHRRHTFARLWIGRARPILLFALVTLGVVVVPSIAPAQQLNLTWVDNSGGQASFIIQRAPGTTGTYTQIAQMPLGVVSYADTTVSLGATYCYQVAAVNSAGMSAFSNPACGSPSGGVTVAVAKADTGAGTVVSDPAGINCGTACSSTYPAGKVITLTATPVSGSSFSGWSGGGCSGTDPCILVGNVSTTVTAPFTLMLNPTPTITSLNPASIVAGSAAFKLTVNGTAFVSGATATVGGQARAETFVSVKQVTIALLATDVASVGNVSVQVTNPAACVGGLCASSTVNLSVLRHRWHSR